MYEDIVGGLELFTSYLGLETVKLERQGKV